jgi:hypothetical protein
MRMCAILPGSFQNLDLSYSTLLVPFDKPAATNLAEIIREGSEGDGNGRAPPPDRPAAKPEDRSYFPGEVIGGVKTTDMTPWHPAEFTRLSEKESLVYGGGIGA